MSMRVDDLPSARGAASRRQLSIALLLALSVGGTQPALADDTQPQRPSIRSNRWEEDWSVFADPRLRTEPLDALKYVPLIPGDPKSYLSLGATVRERYEYNDAPAFGTGGKKADGYLLDRAQVHLDLHLNESWEIFTQLEDDRAPGKKMAGPVDEDQIDLRLAFLAYDGAFENGELKARIGRQDFDFDLQRFVSSRDGPNVRQSFDAAWADWESGPWRVLGFVSQPVQYRSGTPFDDFSDRHFLFHTLRVERQVLGTNELSAYYARYERADAKFPDAAGDETRNIIDVRFAGNSDNIDWDVEAMGQQGKVGASDVLAWATGARLGYTFSTTPWQPRLGLQMDAASGDTHPNDGRLETFNPLFPNGYYFSLAGYTGYANILHVKPSLTLKPLPGVSIMGAVGLQWRETTADAVYVQPNVPIKGTAGEDGSWSGLYEQLRIDWAITPYLSSALEAVHYDVGQAIRRAGGSDSDYVGVELKYSL
ncbi:MAG TPA: alginate export family protein [Terriglobia bacterium]|nr:alginate export family protein [Terriglobia bacterium]